MSTSRLTARAPTGSPLGQANRRQVPDHVQVGWAASAALSGQLPLAVGTDNRAAARTADIILISVKPQNVDELVEEIRANVTPGQLVVSVAASVPVAHDLAARRRGKQIGTQLRCYEPRGTMSCGSPMPRGERIARPAERGCPRGRSLFLACGRCGDHATGCRPWGESSSCISSVQRHDARRHV